MNRLWVANMIDSIVYISISVVVPIITIIVIRSCVVYRVPKKILKVFWIIMICRLLIPVFVPLDFLGSFHINRGISRIIFDSYLFETSGNFNGNVEKNLNNYEIIIENEESIDSLSRTMKGEFIQKQYGFKQNRFFTFVWGFGFLVIAFFILVRHWLFIKKCKEAIPISVDYKGIERISKYLDQIKIRRKIKINQFD